MTQQPAEHAARLIRAIADVHQHHHNGLDIQIDVNHFVLTCCLVEKRGPYVVQSRQFTIEPLNHIPNGHEADYVERKYAQTLRAMGYDVELISEHTEASHE